MPGCVGAIPKELLQQVHQPHPDQDPEAISPDLVSETNIPTVQWEFQTYIRSMDKDTVAVTVQATGHCSINIG